jgi:DeoR family fructose operon transcriptional repressor
VTDFQQVSGVECRRRILAHARDNGRVAVSELAGSLEVAVETVRRDLQVLEDDGLLRRTHGGAYPIEHHRVETPLKLRVEHDSARSNASQPQQWT